MRDVHLLANYALEDELWRDPQFSAIRLLPFSNVRPGWEKTGIFAALHGLQTNHVYVSRIDRYKLDMLRRKEQELIAGGDVEPNVIYITDEETFKKLAGRKDSISARRVDGFPVLTKKLVDSRK